MTDLPTLRATVQKLDQAARAADAQLQSDLAAKAAAKKQRTFVDDLEDKLAASTAVAAAASGTPEQAKAELAKARRKVRKPRPTAPTQAHSMRLCATWNASQKSPKKIVSAKNAAAATPAQRPCRS